MSLAFLYAHPKKFDSEKLKTVVLAEQLFFESKENVDLTVKSFLHKIVR